MDGYLQARWVGAWISVNETLDCEVIMEVATDDSTRATEICTEFSTDPIDNLYVYYKAPDDPVIKQEMMSKTNFTSHDYVRAYSDGLENSIGEIIKEVDAAISKEYNCSNPLKCTTDELVYK
jgi:hypothetical protein